MTYEEMVNDIKTNGEFAFETPHGDVLFQVVGFNLRFSFGDHKFLAQTTWADYSADAMRELAKKIADSVVRREAVGRTLDNLMGDFETETLRLETQYKLDHSYIDNRGGGFVPFSTAENRDDDDESRDN